uniref:Uncharacterized protein n=1 Tax=Glossina pallidipes TaxID=7398 RepID=A0A1B0A5B5_GLOPL
MITFLRLLRTHSTSEAKCCKWNDKISSFPALVIGQKNSIKKANVPSIKFHAVQSFNGLMEKLLPVTQNRAEFIKFLDTPLWLIVTSLHFLSRQETTPVPTNYGKKMRSFNFGIKNSFQGEYKFPIGEHKLMAAFKVRFKVGNCYLRSNCPHVNLKSEKTYS